MQVVAPIGKGDPASTDIFSQSFSPRSTTVATREILIRRERMPSLSFSLFLSRRRSRRFLSSFFFLLTEINTARGMAWRPLSTSKAEPPRDARKTPRAR